MKTILSFIAQLAATVFAAEFVAGFVHWFEDAYIRDTTPVVGKFIGRPNVVHHHYPRHMTRRTWWQSSWDLVPHFGPAHCRRMVSWPVDVACLALCHPHGQRERIP